MKTVIYKMATLKVVRTTDEDVCITSLKDDEDMMPADMWNQSDDVEKV
jgi:hypothetical protein